MDKAGPLPTGSLLSHVTHRSRVTVVSQQIWHPPPTPVAHLSSKAILVAILGASGLLLSPFVGGVVPAVIALVMEGPAAREIDSAAGFLTGGRWIRLGRLWSYLALAVAAVVLAGLAIYGLTHLGNSGSHNADPNLF